MPKKENNSDAYFKAIIFLYPLLVVFMPNPGCFDSNASKFLVVAILNFILLLFVFFRSSKNAGTKFLNPILQTKIGITYSFFIFIVCLSFLVAGNIQESILALTKILVVFFTAILLAVLLKKNRELFSVFCVSLLLILFADCVSVYFNIYKYITGKIPTILPISGFYSHKNILSASIFLKIPIAFWLMQFSNGWKKRAALIGVLLSFFALMLLSSRTFYVGTLLLVLFYFLFLLYEYKVKKEKFQKKLFAKIAFAFLISLMAFNCTQRFLYPVDNQGYDIYNNNFISRIETISSEPGGERLASWKRTINIIKANPLLGVGIGNWKIQSLKEANLTNEEFIYQIKNHNDFLEITAEIGIAGGLAFLLIFGIIIFSFVNSISNHSKFGDNYIFLFVAAFGIVCYFVDAFFNFPFDRPEIGCLFAFFTASGMAYSQEIKFTPSIYFHNLYSKLKPIFKALLVLVCLICIHILYLNFISSKLQRTAFEEMKSGNLKHNSEYFLKNFPSIPTISSVGEPVKVTCARYLQNEKKYNEAIVLLKNSNASNYDCRREFYIAVAYYSLHNADSAMFYAQKAYQQKPYFLNNIELICDLYKTKNNFFEQEKMLKKYLVKEKKKPIAWIRISQLYEQKKEVAIAVKYIDSAGIYLQNDTLIKSERNFLHYLKITNSGEGKYLKALNFYKEKKYEKAIENLSAFILINKTFAEAYEYRAYCYAYIQQPAMSNNDIQSLFSLYSFKPKYFNLSAVNYLSLGEKENACKNFNLAKQMGDENGKLNFEKFCNSQN